MKQYINCSVVTHKGVIFQNPLKLSESHLIVRLLKENKKVEVNLIECDDKTYKFLFGELN